MGLFGNQKKFTKAVVSGKYLYLLFGGAIRSGKTYVGLGTLDDLCQKYPGIRCVVVRKTLSVIRRNTLPSFKKLLMEYGDSNRCTLNKSEWTYTYRNGSELLFIEGDVGTDPDLNKFRGLEATVILLEEANEMQEKVFYKAIERTGQWRNKEYGIPPLVLLTCNPDKNWVKTLFYDPWSNNQLGNAEYPEYQKFFFLQSLPQDNPYNSPEYLESLKNLPPAEYERFVKGNWNFNDNPRQLIQFEWYSSCINTAIPDMILSNERKPKYIGIDVAREGNDYTVLYFGDENGGLWKERYKHSKGWQTADAIELHMSELNIPQENIGCDAIGIGAEVIGSLEKKGIYIYNFKSSESPDSLPDGMEHFSFANKRAEAHWLTRMQFQNGLIDVPPDFELQKQLCAISYDIDNGRIKIPDKKSLKTSLGYSPDDADAFIIMNYVKIKQNSERIALDYARKMLSLLEINHKNRARTKISVYKELVGAY